MSDAMGTRVWRHRRGRPVFGMSWLVLSLHMFLSMWPTQAAGETPLVAIDRPQIPFDVLVPKGWAVQEVNRGKGGKMLRLIDGQTKVEAALQFQYVLRTSGDAPELDRIIADVEKVMRESGLKPVLLSQRSTSVAGLPARENVYKVTIQEDELRQRMIFFVSPKFVYGISLAARPEKYEERVTLYDKVIESFKEK